MNFQEKTKSLLTDDGQHMKLTDEKKAAILSVQNAGNAELYDGIATNVQAVEISKVLESLTNPDNPSGEESNQEVFASVISFNDLKGKEHQIRCATSKATNVVTGDLKDATVMKMTSDLQIGQGTDGAAKASVRDDNVFSFTEKKTSVEDDIVVKKDCRDMHMSATIFPEDMHLSNFFNTLIMLFHVLKQEMLGEFLAWLGQHSPTDNQILTAYRNASRSMLESIFKACFAAAFPKFNEGDADHVNQFLNCRKAFFGKLETIGTKYMSNISITCGIGLRKLSISPDAKWTNLVKIGKAKKFARDKSWYVSTNIDTGLHTVPTTSAILNNHIDMITDLVIAACIGMEMEARMQNGLPYSDLKLPDLSKYSIEKKYSGKSYYELLGIKQDKEAEVYEDLEARAKEIAEDVCNNAITAGVVASDEAIDSLFSRN